MRQGNRLGVAQTILWTGLGFATGLVAGFALSEWVGGVSPTRMRGIARRFRSAPAGLTTSALARAVQTSIAAEPRLAGIAIEILAIRRGVVELRGWVPTRAARSTAGRSALATPGIESVINSLLVRGEDDLTRTKGPRATDQSA